MRLHTKILLMMLAITAGSSALVSWIVTLSVTQYENRRADEQISTAIADYLQHLDDRHEQVSRLVRVLLEEPQKRSLLQAADDSADAAARAQLKEEVLGREIQNELQSRDRHPAFQLLVNLTGEAFVSTLADSDPRKAAVDRVRWPMDAIADPKSRPMIQYLAVNNGLYLVMGVPLRTQLNDAPTDAYFVAFEVNDGWIGEQLLVSRQVTQATGAPLTAWFVLDGNVLARGSSQMNDPRMGAFTASTQLRSSSDAGKMRDSDGDRVEFQVAGENYVGQAFNLNATGASGARLVLASSQDQTLAPLRRLQKQIFLITLAACVAAFIACRFIAAMIARPINELVEGTRRIAAAQFHLPVKSHRRDELGLLAHSFNKMAEGLKERDELREHRVKMERDMAVARKIQMDVLPKSLPPYHGYDLAAFSLPAEQTGGDIYDMVAVAHDPGSPGEQASLVLLLADATGHGIGPALSVTQVRSMLRIGVRLRAQLDDVLAQINRQLCHDLGAGRFVTAFLGLLDTCGHSIDYQSAGQGPLLHFHGKNHHFEWLDTSMLPLGIDEEAISEGVRKINVEPGDLIVLLTDGFYECSNGAGDMFGRERLAEIVLHHHHKSARDLLNEIVQATQRFANGAPQEDDMTAVIIHRLPVEQT